MELYTYLKLRFTRPMSRAKVIQLITDGVLFLAKITDLSGAEKRSLLLTTIVQIINESDLPEPSKELLIECVDSIGSVVIDNLVTLGKDMKAFLKKKCSKCL